MKIAAPKGTRDILPAKLPLGSTSSRYSPKYAGASVTRKSEFRLLNRPVSSSAVWEHDRYCSEKMYTFEDKGGRSMSLRPEGTAGVVRSFGKRYGFLAFSGASFYNITAFRYEMSRKAGIVNFISLAARLSALPDRLLMQS